MDKKMKRIFSRKMMNLMMKMNLTKKKMKMKKKRKAAMMKMTLLTSKKTLFSILKASLENG
jgi:hypothetical protein